MKVLKPLKSASSARTGTSYEPPPSRGGEAGAGTIRWDARRVGSVSGTGEKTENAEKSEKSEKAVQGQTKERAALPRSANPVGGASAFAWMKKPANGE